MPNAGALFEAMYPIVRESRRQNPERKSKFIIASNATRIGTWWWEFWTTQVEKGASNFFGVQTTWEDALRGQGYTEAQIKAERASILRDISLPAFLQWYMCVWRSASEGYFEADLLDRSGYDPGDLSPEDFMRHQTVGYDLGLKVHPCAYAPLLLPTEHKTCGGIAHALRTQAIWERDYSLQRSDVVELASQRSTRCVVMDATGNLTQVEELERALRGRCKLIPYAFTTNSALELLGDVKDGFQQAQLKIDRGDIDLRIELEGAELTSTAKGSETVKIPEERAQIDGVTRVRHGDRAWALALAVRGWRGTARFARPSRGQVTKSLEQVARKTGRRRLPRRLR